MNIAAAVTAASKTIAGIGAKARAMTPAVRQNLAGRSGNVPPNDLFPKIPQGVRMGGEPANLEYLRGGVDVSHKVSIRNAPNQAGRADNVVFESSRVNQARGAHDMSRMEVTSAHVRNALDGLHAGLRIAPKAALRSGLIAGALELPVSAAVNLIRYRGGVSRKQAACNIAKDVVTTSLAGAAAGASIVVVASVGLPIAGPAMVVCSGVGFLAYGASSVGRIHSATRESAT